MPPPNTEANFWAQVQKTQACWLWTGTKPSGRYGRFKLRQQKWAAHRYSWFLVHGPIPAGMHVLHRCDVPACVNPDHLFLGTHDDNMADKAAKGRVVVPAGERNHLSKLTAAQVLAIREACGSGESQTSVASRFGLNQTHVSRIVRGTAWAAIGGPLQPPQNCGRKPKEANHG